MEDADLEIEGAEFEKSWNEWWSSIWKRSLPLVSLHKYVCF